MSRFCKFTYCGEVKFIDADRIERIKEIDTGSQVCLQSGSQECVDGTPSEIHTAIRIRLSPPGGVK